MAFVLVVEDDSDIREAVAELLQAHGHLVTCATDGREGIARAHRYHPDIIFLDLMMPGMNGWQFREEQGQDPVIADIPVVVVSALVRRPDISAVAYIEKPFGVADLLNAVVRFARASEPSASVT